MIPSIKVVEFAEGVAGPLAGLRLAELGASVIKVEPAGGDWLRNAEPQMDSAGTSAAFFHLNCGKRSVALEGDAPANRDLLAGLLRDADVLVTDRSDEDLRELGLGGLDDEVYAANPKLVHVHITPLGRHGPMANNRGSELTAQAMAGYTRYLGAQGAPGRRLGADVASVGTGVFAAQAVLAALLARRRLKGYGQRIDLSLLNSLLSMKSIHLAAQSDPDVYAGPRVGGAYYPPEKGWKTADEPIFFQFGGSVGAEGRPGWVEFIKEVGCEQLLADERFDHGGRNSTGHGVDVNELRPVYEEAFANIPAARLVDVARKHAGNASVYQRADQALAHPQTRALDLIMKIALPGGGAAQLRRFPARFSRSKPGVGAPAPRLGEHTAAVLAEIGLSAQSK
jgi:crotonobetainyl-CoA:carnitine CoA-transferase CaiB-like acyl-CoA transferase